MANWGYKALESDEGLVLAEYFGRYAEAHPDIKMGELMEDFQEEGFLPEDLDDINYYYDKYMVGLAELFLEYKAFEEMKEEETVDPRFKNIHSFTIESQDAVYMVQFLKDIMDEVPDRDGKRQYKLAYKNMNGWKQHMADIMEVLIEIANNV